jgi:hypothetical protein
MSQFEELTSRGSKTSFAADLLYFFKHGKKWWVAPVIALLLLFAGFMLLSGTAAAPFIYTLF